MSIGDKIKAVRIEKNLTQKDVARKCGMADSAIRKYESGKVTPKLETVQRIANALGVGFLDLVEIEMPPTDDPASLDLRDYIFGQAERAKQEGKKVIWTGCGLDIVDFTADERLISAFEQLNSEGQEKLIDYADDLVRSGKYKKNNPSVLDQRQA